MYPQPQWDHYRRYYAGAQPDPDVYMPPPLSAPAAYGFPGRGDISMRYGSVKYPQLFFLLAADTTRLQWDVHQRPSSITASTFFTHRHTIATQGSAKKLRIISKAFPWAIDIESHVPITCEMVWEGIYQALQEPIADSEWGLILNIKKHREVVEKAAKKRREANKDDDMPLRRIDYLGDATMFKGLEKDEDFAKLRLLPGSMGFPDTWVILFKAV